MSNEKLDLSDSLPDILSKPFENVYDGKCQYYCCQYEGSKYNYPSKDGDNAPKAIIACESHVKSFGFCYSCDKFAKSDRKFGINDSRLCNQCWKNAYYDWSRGDGWNDDDWEHLHNG